MGGKGGGWDQPPKGGMKGKPMFQNFDKGKGGFKGKGDFGGQQMGPGPGNQMMRPNSMPPGFSYTFLSFLSMII